MQERNVFFIAEHTSIFTALYSVTFFYSFYSEIQIYDERIALQISMVVKLKKPFPTLFLCSAFED